MDKIANNLATLIGDEGDMRVFDISILYFTLKENDILIYDNAANSYTIDKDLTEKRITENKKRLRKLFERKNLIFGCLNPGGNIVSVV